MDYPREREGKTGWRACVTCSDDAVAAVMDDAGKKEKNLLPPHLLRPFRHG